MTENGNGQDSDSDWSHFSHASYGSFLLAKALILNYQPHTDRAKYCNKNVNVEEIYRCVILKILHVHKFRLFTFVFKRQVQFQTSVLKSAPCSESQLSISRVCLQRRPSLLLVFLLLFSPLLADQSCPGDVDFQNSDWDIKTITSAMKFYLRYGCLLQSD